VSRCFSISFRMLLDRRRQVEETRPRRAFEASALRVTPAFDLPRSPVRVVPAQPLIDRRDRGPVRPRSLSPDGGANWSSLNALMSVRRHSSSRSVGQGKRAGQLETPAASACGATRARCVP